MTSIYQEILLDCYKNPRNQGNLIKPTGKVTVNNPLCGDVINMEVFVEGDIVIEIKFSGSGCIISQALASRLTEFAKNKSKNELRKLDRTFMINLLGMELGPNRLKCALLPLEALQKILNSKP